MGLRSTKSGLVKDHGPSGYVNGKDIDELRLSEPTFKVDFDTSSKIFDLRPALAASMTPKERNFIPEPTIYEIIGSSQGQIITAPRLPFGSPCVVEVVHWSTSACCLSRL
jgi:hypothetical protein